MELLQKKKKQCFVVVSILPIAVVLFLPNPFYFFLSPNELNPESPPPGPPPDMVVQVKDTYWNVKEKSPTPLILYPQ